jgi:hypothetical protein
MLGCIYSLEFSSTALPAGWLFKIVANIMIKVILYKCGKQANIIRQFVLTKFVLTDDHLYVYKLRHDLFQLAIPTVVRLVFTIGAGCSKVD